MDAVVRFSIACLIAVGLFISPAIAEKRVALVIGNSSYTKLQSLANPKNDARLMEKTLSNLGFEVISALDANRINIARAVRKFGKTLRAGGEGTVGLFYYAGHGVQARGVNYLIPLGAEIEDQADLDIEAISINDVLSQMEQSKASVNLVILDACRNNPFKGTLRSVSRGLARARAASGSLVAFAAAPGQVAADGAGNNSPYTKALVRVMQTPGLTVEQVFKRTRISVEKDTGGSQTPWEESSLKGDFFFVSGKTRPVESVVASAPRSIVQTIDPKALELSYWNSIRQSNDAVLFEEYLRRYAKGEFAFIAKRKLEVLNNREGIQVPKSQNRTPAFGKLASVEAKIKSPECREFFTKFEVKPGFKAFALSKNGRWCGAGWGFETTQAAKKRALTECRKLASGTCTVLNLLP